jgi:UDPglucose 6-dehydrogenase/GDP-mannose 6-dehydrogenase
MKLTIIGSGYVGLTTALCLAEKGNEVICADSNKTIIKTLKAGKIPFFEPEADILLKQHLNTRFYPTSDVKKAIQSTNITMLAVGTPFKNGQQDLSDIKSAVRDIAYAIKDKNSFHTIIVKSTVLPGTCDTVIAPLIASITGQKTNQDFAVCMHPEFLCEGSAISDARFPDRIIIGGENKKAISLCQSLYRHFDDPPFFFTNNPTAELIKYTNNAFLATLISFSNDIANLCQTIENVDVIDVLKGLHLDRRFYQKNKSAPGILQYIKSGCGYGGSCLPKDTKALINFAQEKGAPLPLMEATNTINTVQPTKVISLIRSSFPSLKKLKIGVLGVAFKPNTDDIRHSPALPIIDILLNEKATVYAHDPRAIPSIEQSYTNTNLILDKTLSYIINHVDVLILITPWDNYRTLPTQLALIKKQPLFIDPRRVFDKHEISHYLGIGLHS